MKAIHPLLRPVYYLTVALVTAVMWLADLVAHDRRRSGR